MNDLKVRLSDGAETILSRWGDRGPVVLAVHGITSSRYSWKRLGERWQGRFRLYAYDQRGHGDAYAVWGPMSLEQAVRDATAVADAIGEPVSAIIGHSWGGAVALLAGPALEAKRVVAIDPMLYVVPGTFQREFLEDVERDLALPPAERAAMLRNRLAGWHPDDVEGKLHAMRQMVVEPIRRLAIDNRVDEGGWDLRALVKRYPLPLLLLVAGPEDSVIRPEDLNDIEAARLSNIRIRLFPEEGHNLHRTAFADVAAEIETFLAAAAG